ncbi:MAG TPA: hypothetical protein VFX63_07890, partial [Pyrinomonadaceae bacterium]|nr:hypothetical protein [Pyrinomonadaceae bacterium]
LAIGRDSTPNLAAKRHKMHKKEQVKEMNKLSFLPYFFCGFCAFLWLKNSAFVRFRGSCYSEAAF